MVPAFITISNQDLSTMTSTMSGFFSDISPLFFLILGIILVIFIVRAFLGR
jgi:type II secretory pathway component PulF